MRCEVGVSTNTIIYTAKNAIWASYRQNGGLQDTGLTLLKYYRTTDKVITLIYSGSSTSLGLCGSGLGPNSAPFEAFWTQPYNALFNKYLFWTPSNTWWVWQPRKHQPTPLANSLVILNLIDESNWIK